MASSINASTTAGVVTTADTSGVLNIQTAGTTAITVDASQNVTLAGKLGVTKRATFAAPASFDAISASTGTVEAHTSYGNAIAGNGSSYDLMLLNRNGQEALGVIANTQNVAAAGSLKGASTISVGNATPTTSGAGITFPATQSASSNANTLDDYEEGTWNPTIGGNDQGTGGGAGNVYSTQVGTYVKVGKVVTCNCNVVLSTASGNTGVVIFINNWPFPANATTGSLPYVSVSWQGLSSSHVNVMGYFNANESRLHLVGITAAATTIQTFIAPSQLTNTSGFIVTFTYITT